MKCYNCNEFGHFSKNCLHKKDGLKCFKCGKFGHKPNDCVEMGENNKVNLSTPRNDIMKISAIIDGQNVCALVDTGSSRSLLRSVMYLKTGAQHPLNTKILLSGLAGTEIKTFGCFNAQILINNKKFCAPAHVVGNDVIPVDLLIGCDLISEANMMINDNGLTITRKNDLCAILIDENDGEIDISNIVDNKDATVVKQLCEIYLSTIREDLHKRFFLMISFVYRILKKVFNKPLR